MYRPDHREGPRSFIDARRILRLASVRWDGSGSAFAFGYNQRF